jgi:hypothetical protein
VDRAVLGGRLRAWQDELPELRAGLGVVEEPALVDVRIGGLALGG